MPAVLVVRSPLDAHAVREVRLPRLDACRVALACPVGGVLLTVALMQARIAGWAPLWTVALGAVPFHAGLAPAIVGVRHRRAWAWTALSWNLALAALAWLAAASLSGFLRQFA